MTVCCAGVVLGVIAAVAYVGASLWTYEAVAEAEGDDGLIAAICGLLWPVILAEVVIVRLVRFIRRARARRATKKTPSKPETF